MQVVYYWSLVVPLCFNSGFQLFSDVVWFIALNCISRVIDFIFSEVDKHVDAGDVLREYKMSALPILYEQFVKLIKYLVHPCDPWFVSHSTYWLFVRVEAPKGELGFFL